MVGRDRRAVAHGPPHDVPPPLLDQLVHQLEAGSTVAHDRLTALVASPTAGSGGTPSRSTVLDHIARSAAAGSADSLALLIALVDRFDLAGPAIRRLTADAAAVEDIGQEVLLSVSRSIHRFRGEARFTTWLYSLTRNVGVSHLRRHRPTSPLTDDDRLASGSARRVSSVVAQREVLRQAVESLPPRLRDAVILRDIEGLSYAEIAERRGLEVSTVRSRLSRARAMLATRAT